MTDTPTPGPWCYDGRSVFVGDAPSANGMLATTAVPVQPKRPYGEGQANARLIAAAPEMLAALKYIENDDEHVYEMPNSAWAMVRTVIAKAGGG